jgi:iron complex outermembrane receptor protein
MRYFCLYLFCWFCALSARSQDSLPSFEYTIAVTVFDSLNTKEKFVLSDVHEHLFACDLGTALSKQSTMNIVNYGAPGSASLIRSQGLAPDHTALVWGNLPLNSISLGQSDCSLIPVFFFDNIATRPFFSNQFKTSALAGDITLANVENQAPSYTWLQEWTSLNNQFLGLKINESFLGHSIDVRLFHQELNNQFSYRDIYQYEQPTVAQDHNNAQGNGAMVRTSLLLPKQRHLKIEYWAVQRDANLPFRMGIFSNRRENQQDFQQRGKIQLNRNEGNWTHQFAWLNDQQKYHSVVPNVDETSIISDLLANRFQASSEYDRIIGKKLNYHLHGGLAVVYQYVNYETGNSPEETFLSGQFSVTRIAGAQHIKLSSSYESRENKPFPDFLLSFRRKTGRGDLEVWNWSMEAGIQSRVPDFNERFWKPGGNPDLLPEINRTVRGGLEYIRRSRNRKCWLEAEAKPYYNWVINWIQWLPGMDGFWRPQNFKEVMVYGTKLKADYSINLGGTDLILGQALDLCRSIASNSSDDSEKFEMVYTPRLINRSSFTFNYFNKEIGLTYQYTSSRFTDEENSSFSDLPGYEIVSVWLGWRINRSSFESSLRLKCENVFNEQYQSVRLYAMPGRVFSVSLVFNLKNQKK